MHVRVWLNGKDLGEKPFSTGPQEFDISQAAVREGSNTLVISVADTLPIQLGIGGIIRPVLIYSPK